jgi:hypothetical protein
MMALWLGVAAVGCTALRQGAQINVDDVVANGRAAAPDLPLEAIVTDVHPGDHLLVELSDDTGDQHIWVTGFAVAPPRGAEIWTRLIGPPVPNALVGVVYPSTGAEPPVPTNRYVTDSSALAALVGTIGGGAVLAVLLVSSTGWARRCGARRCPGCAAAVADEWQTCPSCATTLIPAPAQPPPPPLLVPAPAGLRSAGLGNPGAELGPTSGTAPTRIIPANRTPNEP